MSQRDIFEKMRLLKGTHPSGEVGTVIEAIMIQEDRMARMENDISKLKAEMQQLRNSGLKRY